MRKCIILALSLLFTVHLYAPNSRKGIEIWEPTPVKNIELENKKLKILRAIWWVEHPRTEEQAINSYYKEGALGPFQIHREVVDDVNNLILKKKVYTHQDCKDSIKSVEILTLYHSRYNPTFDYYKTAMVQNGGPDWKYWYNTNIKVKKRLDNYWNKVKKLI